MVCDVWSVVCRLWSLICGSWSMVCGGMCERSSVRSEVRVMRRETPASKKKASNQPGMTPASQEEAPTSQE